MNAPSLSQSAEVDLHRVDTPYAATRLHAPRAVRRLLASIEADGQQVPLIAVEWDARLVLVDGYRRLEALKRLGRDTARVVVWHCPLSEALAQVLSLSQGRAFEPIEQAWLLAAALSEGMSQRALATAVGKDPSWVSRRLALLSELSEPLQEAVRAGVLSTWAATRVFVPLARANAADAEALLRALRTEPLSTRQLATWLEHYRAANSTTRARLLAHPQLFIQALRAEQAPALSPEAQWLQDLEHLRRQMGRLTRVLVTLLEPSPSTEIRQALRTAVAKAAQSFERLRRPLQEGTDAVRTTAPDDHPVAPEGHGDPGDQPHPGPLAHHGAPGAGGVKPQRRADEQLAREHLAAARAVLQGTGQRGADAGTTA